MTISVTEKIRIEADPVGFLIQVAKGEPQEAASSAGAVEPGLVYPTLEQRIRAHLKLLGLLENESKEEENETQDYVDPVLLRDRISVHLQNLARREQN